MKIKFIALALILPIVTMAQAPVTYFEFNDDAGASFNTAVNSGSDTTTWNNGGNSSVATDGAGSLVIQGDGADPLAGGQIFRKTLYPSTFDSGNYRIEIDFASWALDTAQAANGKIEIGVYEGAGFATKVAAIALKVEAGATRIQFFGENAAGDIYRNIDLTGDEATGLGVLALDLDLDNDTITCYTNGIATHTGIAIDNKVIGNFQFTCQNLSASSTASINRMGLIDLDASGDDGGDDGGEPGDGSDTDLEAWEFGESGNVSFNTFANTGSNASSWNWGGPSTVATDGAGFLEVGGANGAVAGGQVFRKIDYTSNPYTTGVYRLEIDFDSATWGASDTDGNVRFAIGNALGNAYNVASITAQANDGSPRIQFFAASTNGATIYRNVDAPSVVGIIELDLDNSTVSMTTNGVTAVASQPIPADTTIAAMQFSLQNFDADSSVKVDYMKFTQVGGSGGGDDDGGDDGGGDDVVDANANTDASSIWATDPVYAAVALEKFEYNESGNASTTNGGQFAAINGTPSPTEADPDRLVTWGVENSGTLGSSYNFGGGSVNRTDGAGNLIFLGKGGEASNLFRTLPNAGQYADPIDSGVIEFVVDFDSVNLDATALSTGNTIDFGAYVGQPSENNLLVGISVNAHTNGQARIQVRGSSTNTAAGVVGNYRSMLFDLDADSLPKVSAVADLDNDTIAYYTNGVPFGGTLDGIEASAQIDAIRVGLGADGSAASTVSIDAWALYQRVDRSSLPITMVDFDGVDLGPMHNGGDTSVYTNGNVGTIYITGTNTILDLTGASLVDYDSDVLDDNPTNDNENSGQDFYFASAHSAVFDQAAIDAAAAAGYTNGGGGRGALVISAQGAQSHQRGAVGIHEQSNNPDYLVPAEDETSYGLVFFDKSEFLGGLDSTNVVFTEDSDTLSADVVFGDKGRWKNGHFRFVVKDAGEYYISSETLLIGNNYDPWSAGAASNITAEALSTSWSAYDPIDPAGVITTIGSPVATPTFENIEGVGFLFGVTWGDGSDTSQWAQYKVSSFSALGRQPVATPPTAYGTWLSDNGYTALSDDSDSDGRTLLMEYALGTDPTSPDGSGITHALSSDASSITFSHPKRAGTDHGLVYTLQTSPTLIEATWSDVGTVSSDNADASVSHTLSTGSDATMYIRLNVVEE